MSSRFFMRYVALLVTTLAIWMPTPVLAQMDGGPLLEFSHYWRQAPQDETAFGFDFVEDNVLDEHDLLLLIEKWKMGEPRLAPRVAERASEDITREQGGVISLPSGSSIAIPPGAVEDDASVSLVQLQLDESAENNGVLAAVEIVADSGAAGILGTTTTLTFVLPTPRSPGARLPFYILLYASELDPNVAPADDRAVYLYVGQATVDGSGTRALAEVRVLGERYVLRDEESAAQKARQQAKARADSAETLPTGLRKVGGSGPQAVVLIHGIHSNESTGDEARWQNFIDYVEANHSGEFTLYSFVYDAQQEDMDISNFGKALRDAVEAVAELKGTAHFMIVAHSMGGLVARSYIAEHGGHSKVDRLISLATPHHGSPGAIPLWMRYSLHGGYVNKEVTTGLGSISKTYHYVSAVRIGSGEEYWFTFGDPNPYPVYRNNELSARNLSWNNFDLRVPSVPVYKYEENLVGITILGKNYAVSPVMFNLSPEYLDTEPIQGSQRNDYLESLSLVSGQVRDHAYFGRYVLYGGYDADLTDNADFAEAFAAQVFKIGTRFYRLIQRAYGPVWKEVSADDQAIIDAWADHRGLSYAISRMADVIGSEHSRPYQANDGFVPLSSALYLADGSSIGLPVSVPQVGGPADLPGFRGLKYRLYPNHDHLAMVAGDAPGSTLFADIVTDLQAPGTGSEEITINLPNLPQGAIPLTLVRIPAGGFMMGRYPGEQDSSSDEEPQHQVNIGYDFYMGKYELTKAQWQALMGTTPWQGQSYVLDDPDSPAIYVSWNDILHTNGLLDKLNALGQGTFRLPSEAEWEYACRAGTSTRFYWGDDPNYTQIGNYAWYYTNAWSNAGEQYAHVVGLKLPNAWGLYDITGNVWEWCQDWYHEGYVNAPLDGSAWEAPAGSIRVYRGGGSATGSAANRSSYRGDGGLATTRSYVVGLRVVWVPPAEVTINLPDLPAGAKQLTFVKIPAGSFMMGRYAGEQDSFSTEDPQHEVSIGYDFYIGKYELTKAQWQALMGTTPWQGQEYVIEHPDSPAIYISWNDIRDTNGLLDRLNALGQGTFRLPSEAEWEYACRAGSTTRFYWGDDADYTQIGDYGWYYGNAWDAGEQYAHIVGLKLPNPWGLYDMIGNAWEWCGDDWHGSYGGVTRPDDGASWIDIPRGSHRVGRGGAFRIYAGNCRSAYRDMIDVAYRYDHYGMRLVRAP